MVTTKRKDVRPELVETLGGEAVVAEAHLRNQTYIDAPRLAERRTALGLTQAEVADRMGITKSRVSQIERGEVSTVNVIARYVQAICGQLQISAVFRQRPAHPPKRWHEWRPPRSSG
jgi:DNA-binding XRE family transcriptional regulator